MFGDFAGGAALLLAIPSPLAGRPQHHFGEGEELRPRLLVIVEGDVFERVREAFRPHSSGARGHLGPHSVRLREDPLQARPIQRDAAGAALGPRAPRAEAGPASRAGVPESKAQGAAANGALTLSLFNI